jgi:MYXO-CTERM domain-containing protein
VDTTKLPEGDLTITVIAADTRGNVNAMETMTLRVENRPDLEVVRIELERSEVAVGETAKARVTVRNTGHSTANGFEVRLMAGTLMLDSTTEALGLKAGTEKTYTLQWTVRGEGTQTIRALVDANNVVSETQEGNNGSQELNLSVAKDSPGPTALLAAVAVGGLAGMMRRRRRNRRDRR